MSSVKAITQHLDDISGKDGVGLEEFFKNIGHHDKTFQVRLQLQQLEAEGVGKSKKMAEQDAARKALELLKAK